MIPAQLATDDPLQMIRCNPYRAWLSKRACGLRFKLSKRLRRNPRKGPQKTSRTEVARSCGLCIGCPAGKENRPHGRTP
jgi:hypothetical protein